MHKTREQEEGSLATCKANGIGKFYSGGNILLGDAGPIFRRPTLVEKKQT